MEQTTAATEQPAVTAEQPAAATEQPAATSQRFYALEQLADRAQTIRLIVDALQVYREQIDQ